MLAQAITEAKKLRKASKLEIFDVFIAELYDPFGQKAYRLQS